MNFTKMHGLGNDYIYVDTSKEKVDNPSELSVKLSDRHFGVGADGLILINPSDVADFEMEMYNADGSRGEMCGNGIRCVGKYVYDFGLTDKKKLSIETLAGIKYLDLTVEDGKVTLVRVDMGEPVFAARQIPVDADSEEVISAPIKVLDKDFTMTCLSMGNPHAVVPVEDVSAFDIEKYGPAFENNKLFPKRINTEFIRVIDRKNVEMRVWERGSGETFACGTGACAVAVACARLGLTDREADIKLLGGTLHIEWEEKTNHVFMTGPATTVFTGQI